MKSSTVHRPVDSTSRLEERTGNIGCHTNREDDLHDRRQVSGAGYVGNRAELPQVYQMLINYDAWIQGPVRQKKEHKGKRHC